MAETIELNSFEELARRIEELPLLALEAAEAAMHVALMTLHGELPEYPPRPAPGLASQFWTPRQRRWFFWALRKGMIQVPYRRTETLGRQFTEQVTRDEKSVTGQLGTATPYAPWVVGPDYPGETIRGQTMHQARIHQNRWWQFQAVMDEATPAARDAFNESFFQEFDKRVREGK
jgi:hypothetical protein